MSWAGRNRALLLVVAAVLVGTAVGAWLSSRGSLYDDALDPENPRPNGAQAVARVLANRGVEVEIVRSSAELDRTDVTDATIVVTSSRHLGKSTYGALLAHSGDADIVVVNPDPATAKLFAARSRPRVVLRDRPVEAECANVRLSGLTLGVDQALAYKAYPGSCFATSSRGAIYTPVGRNRAFFGAGNSFANDEITREDNAAIALRLLGEHDHLIWYVPSLADLEAGDEVGLSTLLPRWLEPGLWLGAFTLLGLMVWRARRLGPLVTEPLPVAVKAIETTQSRSRLYRKAGDRQHAAAALQAAACARAAERLGLPRSAGPARVAADLARHTGRSVEELHALLLPGFAPPPHTDKELINLATTLATLDDELRKAPR